MISYIISYHITISFHGYDSDEIKQEMISYESLLQPGLINLQSRASSNVTLSDQMQPLLVRDVPFVCHGLSSLASNQAAVVY